MKMIWSCLLSLSILLLSAGAIADTNFTYYVNDALGSPVVAMNQAGDVIWRKTYEPYGKSHGKDGDNRIGYTGHVEDKPDLVYAGARYYDPDLMRFLSDDPVRFTEKNPMSFNRYAYANNNPYKYVDPDGRDTINVSTNIQVPAFFIEKLGGMEGLSGLHSGVAIEFPGLNGGEWDIGGFYGVDFATSVGMGKATLNVGYDKGSISEMKNTSIEASALIGGGEFGASFDADSLELQGGHVGIGLAPGGAIKALKNLVSGIPLAKAYTNNMISVAGSVNLDVGSARKGEVQ